MNYGSDMTTLQVSKAGTRWDRTLHNILTACIIAAYTQTAAQAAGI